MTQEQDKQKDRKEEMSKMDLEGISGSGANARDRASGLANPITGDVSAPSYSLTVEELKGVSGGKRARCNGAVDLIRGDLGMMPAARPADTHE